MAKGYIGFNAPAAKGKAMPKGMPPKGMPPKKMPSKPMKAR